MRYKITSDYQNYPEKQKKTKYSVREIQAMDNIEHISKWELEASKFQMVQRKTQFSPPKKQNSNRQIQIQTHTRIQYYNQVVKGIGHSERDR